MVNIGFFCPKLFTSIIETIDRNSAFYNQYLPEEVKTTTKIQFLISLKQNKNKILKTDSVMHFFSFDPPEKKCYSNSLYTKS